MNEERSFSGGENGSKNSETPSNPRIPYNRLLPYLYCLYLNRGKPVTYKDLNEECRKWGITRRPPKIDDIKNHIDWLIEKGFPIFQTSDNKVYWNYLAASQLLDNTKALASLNEHVDSNSRLAKKVVDILESHPELNRNMFMGIGSTVHAVFREMQERRINGKLGRLDTVYTDNLLIVFEYLHHENTNYNLVVLNGRLHRDWVRMHFDKLRLGHPVLLSITSFKGFDKTYGFSSDDQIDKKNKKMSIKPDDDCKLVIIPMSLDKFGAPMEKDDVVVEIGDLKEGIKYIFVTDEPVLPRDAVNKEHVDWLRDNAKKLKLNVEIQYVSKETNS